ncbi:MAG: hypothetical protein WKF77_00160 [Planctomycetaceae bacterium]
MNVFIHGAAATPTPLLEAMCHRPDLEGIRLYHMHTEGPAPFLQCLCRASRLRKLPAGAKLFQEVAVEDEVFVISSGR